MRDYIWIIAALLGLTVVAYIIAFHGFNLGLWFSGLYMVILSFYYALTFTKTSHSWLCVYSFQGGTGRMLIQADYDHLSKDFIEAVDKYIAKTNPELGTVCVYNMQYLGRTPV